MFVFYTFGDMRMRHHNVGSGGKGQAEGMEGRKGGLEADM